MKNKKILLKIIIMLITIFFILQGRTQADVGSFESYDSGGSSSSYDSSYSGSSYDSYDRHYGGSSESNNYFTFTDIWFIGALALVIILTIIAKHTKETGSKGTYYTIDKTAGMDWSFHTNNEINIEKQIREIDPAFSKEKLIAWSKNLFVKLQNAWTERDWESIRQYETLELYEQHKMQLQGYIDNNQINVMERICVNRACLHSYRKDGDKETLTVILNSRMADYIIDATTKKIIRGDKYAEMINNYLLTFIRKDGAKTGENSDVKQCPNCGAPISVTSLGVCEYCHSAIVIEEREWALANLERYEGR